MNTWDTIKTQLPKGPTGRLVADFLVVEKSIIDFIRARVDRVNQNAKRFDIAEFDFGKFPSNIRHIALNVQTEMVDIKQNTMNSVHLSVNVVLTLLVKRPLPEKFRRDILLPVSNAIIRTLALQHLGLEIEPLVPVGAREVTDEKLHAAQFSAMQLKFRTGWTIGRDFSEDGAVSDAWKLAETYLSDDGAPVMEGGQQSFPSQGNQ